MQLDELTVVLPRWYGNLCNLKVSYLYCVTIRLRLLLICRSWLLFCALINKNTAFNLRLIQQNEMDSERIDVSEIVFSLCNFAVIVIRVMILLRLQPLIPLLTLHCLNRHPHLLPQSLQVEFLYMLYSQFCKWPISLYHLKSSMK